MGSVAGGNVIKIDGGPFIEGETRVDIGGADCEIVDLSTNQISCLSPPKLDDSTDSSSCDDGGLGSRGFQAKVWPGGIWVFAHL
jgi:hypothetical protein